MEKAAEALQDAVVLRLGLGQEEQAIEDADLFNKNYGAQKPAQTAQIAFAIGAHYVEQEDWDKARKRLVGAMRPDRPERDARRPGPGARHARPRLREDRQRATSAATEYNKVRALWKDPAAPR